MQLTKDSPIEIAFKSISGSSGAFEGWASVYGEVDSYGDVVERGAFADSIKANGGVIPILYQHDTRQPIGLGRLTDTNYGLKVNVELNLDVQAAREAYSNLKKRILRGLSIGYTRVSEQFDNFRQVNRILKLNLLETSLVTFQACPGALVTDVKRHQQQQVVAGDNLNLSPAETAKIASLLDMQTARLKDLAASIKGSGAPAGGFWYREESQFDIPEEKLAAAIRALKFGCTSLSIGTELRWIRPELDYLARPDYGRKTWKGKSGPVYHSDVDILGQAWLTSNFMLIRSDLSVEDTVHTVLHECKHLADAAWYGIAASARAADCEQRAQNYASEHYRRFLM